MKYCKNCGKETSKKICPHCGTNSKKASNYCRWCGNEINKDVITCPNCHEKQKNGIGTILCNIVCIMFFLIFASMAIGFLTEKAILTSILFLVLAVLALPLVQTLIKQNTHGSKGKRRLLTVTRVLAIIIVFVLATATIPQTETIENKVYKEPATEAALEVFHNEIDLKNEKSFVLNDSDVTYENSYNGNDNLALVTVVLDYSAQNGFGGMNRDKYTVKLIFNYAHGTYRPLD